MNNRVLITVSEAARRLGVWPNAVRHWIEVGHLEAFRIEGKEWHVYVETEQVETLALMQGKESTMGSAGSALSGDP